LSSSTERLAWRVLSVTTVGIVLSGLNTSTLEVALPAVSRHFGAGAAAASWFLLSYMVVNTVLILVLGRVADLLGRRRVYLAGLAVFTLASLACGLAPSAGTLITLRAVQAAGGAAVVTNTNALLTDVFPRELLAQALSLNVTAVSAAQLAGPLLGGAMTTWLDWRAVFWFNVPIGLAGLWWAWVVLPRVPRAPERESFDVTGSLLTFVWLGGLIVVVSLGGVVGWTSAPVLAGAVAGLIALWLFVRRQRRRPEPLIDLALFDSRERRRAFVATFLMAIARFAVVLLASLYLQAARGLDAIDAGLQVLPVAGGIMLASPVAGRLSRRVGTQALSTAGMLVTGAGLLTLALMLTPSAPYGIIGVALFAVGAGAGLFLTPNTASIMLSVEPDRRGIANGVRAMLNNTGYTLSIALSLAIVTGPLTPPEKRSAYSGSLSQLPGDGVGAFVGGLHRALYVLLAMTVAGAAVTLLRSRAAVPAARLAPQVGADSR
jgi:EmrB/QacA subfamily drug resistance transporter